MPQKSPAPSGSSRIYVVDDEWIIAENIAAILQKNGFRSQAFHNPGQALVRAIADPPDVLITDVMMPGMTGIELAVSLRAARVNCGILLMSGQTDAYRMLEDARCRGYDFDLLDKPLHPLQLLLRLRHMHRRSRGQKGKTLAATQSIPARPRPAA